MATLATVQDYVSAARVLLQDELDAPYRYGTDELVNALNFALLEVRRLRPDLVRGYLSSSPPSYSSSSMSTAVDMDVQYRLALLYYICGHAQLRDDEATQDSRATVFLNKFTAQMLTIGA
jgi:hypothetical protein